MKKLLDSILNKQTSTEINNKQHRYSYICRSLYFRSVYIGIIYIHTHANMLRPPGPPPPQWYPSIWSFPLPLHVEQLGLWNGWVVRFRPGPDPLSPKTP